MSSGIEWLDPGDTAPGVIGLKITGKVSGNDLAQLVERIEACSRDGEKARVYVDMTGFVGYELDVVREKLTNMSVFWNGLERCAYVVDNTWYSHAIGLVDAVTPMHLRAFRSNDREQALAWVAEGSPATA